MNDTNNPSSKRGNTPRKGTTPVPVKKVCSNCQQRKTKDHFPKRQWERKSRRCFSCFSGAAPFTYNPPGTSPLKKNVLEQKFARLADEENKTAAQSTEEIQTRKSSPPAKLSGRSKTSMKSVEQPRDHIEPQETTSRDRKQSTPSRVQVKSRNRIPLRKNAKDKSPEAESLVHERGMTEENFDTLAPISGDVSNDNNIEGSADTFQIVNNDIVLNNNVEEEQALSHSEENSRNGEASSTRYQSCRRVFMLFASPLVDENGGFLSIIAGMFTLILTGSLLGFFAKKKETLPTYWYQYFSAMIGYTYFICWSISFYPQVISNFRRKSTSGLSPDFCALNVIGFGAYTAYNASLFWSPTIRTMYREKYGSEVSVESNDVAFAIHAFVLSMITFVQIMYYGGSKRPSNVIISAIASILAICASYPALILCYKKSSWLDYLYVLSYVKIGISLIKYIPQVILNYRRRSTSGWSIWNIILDFTGGILSVLQLVFDCADLRDFSGISGNLAKFFLGFVSIFFDIIFLTQHYILYPSQRQSPDDPRRPETEPLLDPREPNLAEEIV